MGGDTGDAPARTDLLLSLEELVEAAENALECAAIEVDVWETKVDGSRDYLQPEGLYRLIRCLRASGLIDERRDTDEDVDT